MTTGLVVLPDKAELDRGVRRVLDGLPNVDALVRRLGDTAGQQMTGRTFAGILEDLLSSWAPSAPRQLVVPFLIRIIDQVIDGDEARQSAYGRILAGTRATSGEN